MKLFRLLAKLFRRLFFKEPTSLAIDSVAVAVDSIDVVAASTPDAPDGVRRIPRQVLAESVAETTVTEAVPEIAVEAEAAETHSISGNVGAANARVFLISDPVGSVTKLAVSDEKGFYIFEGLLDGAYTVLPYKSGETFRPIQTVVIVAGSDLAHVDFIDPSSPSDSRDYGNFPNKPRTVQGSVFFDIGSPDSRIIPALTPSFAIASCGAAVGGQTTYTGTFTPASLPVNSIAIVSGFVGPTNNGSFQIVSVNGATLVLANSAGIAETHAATVVPNVPVDSRAAGAPIDCRVSIPQNSRT